MSNLLKSMLFFLLLISHNIAFSEVGMVTGSKTGTYIKLGKEIAAVAKKKGVNIAVITTRGSLDNINKMMSSENAAFGIVQSDIMSYLSDSKNAKLKKSARKLKMIFPFHNEELHILASNKIKTLTDLNGKKVYIGPAKSGTSITAMTLFKLINIRPKINNHPRLKKKDNYIRAVSLLLNGDIDAVFYVSGKPTPLFSKNLRQLSDMQGGIRDKVHFLAVLKEQLPQDIPYVASTLTHKDYDYINNGREIPTIAVKAMLVAYDFSSVGKKATQKKIDYYQLRCGQIYKISQAIKENLPKLKANGHEAWKSINLNQNIGMWEKNKCSIRKSELSCEAEGDCSTTHDCNAISDPIKRMECEMQ